MQVVGLSYDSTEILSDFSKKHNISFPLLSDEGSKTIKALDLEFKKGLPYPGTFLIGTDGKVKGKLFIDNYTKRHSVEETLALVDKTITASGGSGSAKK